MKRALVLYHSLFGNTRAVAESLAQGIREVGIEVDCQSIDAFDITEISRYNFIAIGSPTHMIRPSKEMKEFLKKLRSIDLSGLTGFSFDTRNESRMNKSSWSVLENSAARSIERALKRVKVRIIRSRVSAIVHGREGPLDTGVEEIFLQIGKEIGRILAV
jgi:menaquinone-dependent protoporphyrinogen IX oxidase